MYILYILHYDGYYFSVKIRFKRLSYILKFINNYYNETNVKSNRFYLNSVLII